MPAAPTAASVTVYFGLTFLLAWVGWLTAASLTSAVQPSPLRELFFLPGTIAPAVVALLLTARAEGRAGVDALLSRLFVSQVPARWYVFAVGYMAAAKLTAAIAHRLVMGVWPVFGDTPWYLMLLAIVASTPVQAGEEIGWRGYALPRLASRLGLAPASVLLGTVWALWHLPLFYIPNVNTTGQPFLPYLAYVTALSVAMAWLYAQTRGSLLLVMLMHAAINNTTGIVPAASPVAGDPLTLQTTPMAWLTVAVLWVPALYFLVRMPRLSLPRTD